MEHLNPVDRAFLEAILRYAPPEGDRPPVTLEERKAGQARLWEQLEEMQLRHRDAGALQ